MKNAAGTDDVEAGGIDCDRGRWRRARSFSARGDPRAGLSLLSLRMIERGL
jgi:hypothetical protein